MVMTRYTQHNWDAVPHTVNYGSSGASDGRNNDNALVFVGWAKHALFSEALTAWQDNPSQGCGREFRAADWWYVAFTPPTYPSTSLRLMIAQVYPGARRSRLWDG